MPGTVTTLKRGDKEIAESFELKNVTVHDLDNSMRKIQEIDDDRLPVFLGKIVAA